MKTKLLIILPGAIITLVITVLSVALVLMLRNWIINVPDKSSRTVVVNLIMPPPLPPKPEEKVIEPEQKIEEVKLDEPLELPDPNDQPPPGDLGLDADGSGAGDGFGLLGRKGGRGLLDGGPFAGYTNQLQKVIYDALYENENIRKKRYSVVVSIWFEGGGRVKKIELQGSSGDKDIDKEIRHTIMTLSHADVPPEEMPQPINLRIASRG